MNDDLDLLDIYMDDVGRIPLLTAEQEQTATPQELVEHNLRWAIKVAKEYQHRGLDLMDLIQAGNLGLMRAAEKYDRRGRFTTYAIWWIRQSVSRAVLDQGRTIRLPVHIAESVGRARRAERDAGRVLTTEETAAACGWTTAKAQSLALALREPISIEAPAAGNNPVHNRPRTLGEVIAAPDEDFAAGAVSAECRAAIAAALAQLSERERAILTMRYLSSDETLTLGEVGLHFGLTRERIRQIEAEALRKLRHPAYGAGLRSYLEA